MTCPDIEGVVLAAGLSSRSGAYKMTLPLGDKTVIEHTIAGMDAFVCRIHVVVGWQAERIEALLAPHPQVEIVLNERFREGMFSSVRVGLARVEAPRCFLTPGDYPLIGAEVYRRLLQVQEDLVIPTCGGKKGHPLLLSRALIPEILALTEGSTLRDFVSAKQPALVEVEDEGILLDLDTPYDYDVLLERYRRLEV